MADIVGAAAAPAEKIVETVAKPLGMAATVRKVPDWAWILLTVAVVYYAVRWWKRRQRALAAAGGVVAGTAAVAPPKPIATGPTQPTAPVASAPAPAPAGVVSNVGAQLGGLANSYVGIGKLKDDGSMYDSPPIVVDHYPPGTIY